MTKEELNDIIQSTKNEIPNVLAIYLTGSRLNNLNTRDTDFDLIVIIRESAQHLITGGLNRQTKDFKTPFDREINTKIYSGTQLARLLIKPTPNTVEIFYKKPIYVHNDFLKIANELYSDDYQRNLLSSDQRNFLNAVFSKLINSKKYLEKNSLSNFKLVKDIVQTLKFFRYANELLNFGNLCSVEKPSELELELKKRSYNQIISNTELLDILNTLEIKMNKIEENIINGKIILKPKQEIKYNDYLPFIIF